MCLGSIELEVPARAIKENKAHGLEGKKNCYFPQMLLCVHKKS